MLRRKVALAAGSAFSLQSSQPFEHSLQQPLLSLQFVQKQGTQLLVMHRLDLSIFVAHRELRKHLRDLLSDESILNWLRAASERLRVAEGDRPELEEPPARFAHIADVFLIADG